MSKAAAGVLATSLGELHATTPAAASAGGHQETIRALLREQKPECAALHANALFREFRDKQRHMKSNAVAQDSGQPPVIDDLEAEGQSRLLDVIRAAAADRQAEPAGVWSSFGKPYQCLGELQQLEDCRVPRLNRDELQQRRPQQQQQQQRAAGGQAAAAGSFAAAAGGAAKKAARAVASQRQSAEGFGHAPGSGSREAEEAAHLLRHKTVMQFSTVDRSGSRATQQEQRDCSSIDLRPHGGHLACMTAAVVGVPLLQAGGGLPCSCSEPGQRATQGLDEPPQHLFNKSKAAADAADPAGYGRHQLPFKQLPALGLVQHHQAAATAASLHAEQPAGRGTAAAAAGDRSCVFITQRANTGGRGESAATAGNGGTKNRHKASTAKRSGHAAAAGSNKPSSHAAAARSSVTAECQLLPEAAAAAGGMGCVAEASSVLCGSSSSTSASSSHHTKQLGGVQQQQQHQPVFKPLTELALQAPGANSPVTDWHNDFVKVRHAGYTSLQASLWQRSQDRVTARADPAAAGQLQRLMGRLDAVRGHLAPGWTPGVVPESPFAAGAKQRSSAAAAAADNAAGGGGRAIKLSEVEVLEHFYNALCSLVERQRLSDPLSLLVVHQVKALLEGGTFLQPALLQQVVDGVAEFVVSCGLLRHNRFALPLLTFISKCVGVSQQELNAMVAAAGITAVLHEPSKAAAEAAMQQGAAVGSPAAASGAWLAEQQQQAGSRSASLSRCSTRGRGSLREAAAAGADSGSNSGQRIASEDALLPPGAQQHQACTAAAVPPIHIDAAAAAAAADIEQAVHSAPNSRRTIAVSAAGAKSVRVRVPGVAGQIELPQQHSPRAAAAAAGGRPGSGGGVILANSAVAARAVAAEDDEPLPELGLDEAGQPLSRRLRHKEGLQNWAAEQAAAANSRTAGVGGEATDDEQEGSL